MDKIVKGAVLKLANEINGENQQFPGDSDFEVGTKVAIVDIDIDQDIAIIADINFIDELFAVTLSELKEAI